MNEKELEYMLSEIAKTKSGRERLKRSAKMIEKYPLPEIKDTGVIEGQSLPSGTPFRLLNNK